MYLICESSYQVFSWSEMKNATPLIVTCTHIFILQEIIKRMALLVPLPVLHVRERVMATCSPLKKGNLLYPSYSRQGIIHHRCWSPPYSYELPRSPLLQCHLWHLRYHSLSTLQTMAAQLSCLEHTIA